MLAANTAASQRSRTPQAAGSDDRRLYSQATILLIIITTECQTRQNSSPQQQKNFLNWKMGTVASTKLQNHFQQDC